MKKMFLMASALLLLVSCADETLKEQDPQNGPQVNEMQKKESPSVESFKKAYALYMYQGSLGNADAAEYAVNEARLLLEEYGEPAGNYSYDSADQKEAIVEKALDKYNEIKNVR